MLIINNNIVNIWFDVFVSLVSKTAPSVGQCKIITTVSLQKGELVSQWVQRRTEIAL